MSALQRPMTCGDLVDMPDDGLRREVIGGELIVTPAPSVGHQRVLANLYDLLRDFLREVGNGELLFAPVDLRLGHFNIVQPDLIYLSGAHRKAANAEHTIDVTPELVIEVVSPSSGGIDRVRKMALYASAGVPGYWIADPIRRSLEVYALADEEYLVIAPGFQGRLSSRVLPGLVVDPALVFTVLD